MPKASSLRIVGTGGANRAMEAELKRLAKRGLDDFSDPKPKRVDEQTLVYPFSESLAWLATHYLRTPSRILWDLFETDAERLEPLYDEVRSWVEDTQHRWFTPGFGLSVRARDVEWFPASRTQIQGTIKNALIDGTDGALHLEPENPDVLLSVRGTNNRLALSVDLAGASMNNHGYRLDRDEAPLRENLAAQLLILSRWNSRQEVLIDPMCGSGTIAIEAALMARAETIWPGDKRPAIEHLPPFAAREPDCPPLFADASAHIIGNDVHTPALDAAKKNAERANVLDRVSLMHGDFRHLGDKRLLAARDGLSLDRGLILTNPPYGERLKPAELRTLYMDLRDWVLNFGAGWRAGFLVNDDDFESLFPQQPKMKKPVQNGPLKCRFFLYDLTPV